MSGVASGFFRCRHRRHNATASTVAVVFPPSPPGRAGGLCYRPKVPKPRRAPDGTWLVNPFGSTLHADLDKAEALAAQRKAETEAARKRVDELVTELLALSQALAERARLAERP
jgi:hypothetical protein